jgi:hypothetical protein
MKATITVGFGTTIQATQYHPIESHDSITMEVDVADEAALLAEYEKMQNIIRTRVIANAFAGVREYLEKRGTALDAASE